MKKGLCILTVLVFLLLSPCAGAEPADVLNSEDSFVGVSEYIGNIDSVGDYCIMQGGCVTEDYGWFALLDKNTTLTYYTTESIIVKYDMKTMQQIGQSEMLKLGHANDITYKAETNELYVIHVNMRQVSVIDADTLEVKQTHKLPVEGHGIAYVPELKLFVCSYDKGGMFFVNENSWKLERKYIPGIRTSLVTQGIYADDQYIYHILWSSRSNEYETESIFLVYDWDGNIVTRIPIGMKDFEPENVSLVGDTFYIACNNYDDDGQAVFKLKIEKAK